jgi:hypothetical protein
MSDRPGGSGYSSVFSWEPDFQGDIGGATGSHDKVRESLEIAAAIESLISACNLPTTWSLGQMATTTAMARILRSAAAIPSRANPVCERSTNASRLPSIAWRMALPARRTRRYAIGVGIASGCVALVRVFLSLPCNAQSGIKCLPWGQRNKFGYRLMDFIDRACPGASAAQQEPLLARQTCDGFVSTRDGPPQTASERFPVVSLRQRLCEQFCTDAPRHRVHTRSVQFSVGLAR